MRNGLGPLVRGYEGDSTSHLGRTSVCAGVMLCRAGAPDPADQTNQAARTKNCSRPIEGSYACTKLCVTS